MRPTEDRWWYVRLAPEKGYTSVSIMDIRQASLGWIRQIPVPPMIPSD